MAHDNNITIGSIGAGNTVNVAQHQAPDAPHVEYTVAASTVQHLSRSEVNAGALACYLSFSLPFLAIAADGLGVLSYLGIQTKWALAVVLPVAFAGAILTNTKRKIAATSFTPNEATFIDGRYVAREDNGSYVSYQQTAPCIYLKCSGTVFIRPAPPREQPNHTLVGVCDVGAHRHTYTVDFNGIGFPQQFDWRAREERKS